MKFTIKIEDTDRKFRVHVFANNIEVYSCGWHGGEFQFNDQWYTVMGPYHSLEGSNFRVYELVPASELV